jgi:hypothetical protein
MFRFIGIAWNSASETASAAAARLASAFSHRVDWTRVAGLPGLQVFLTGALKSANRAYTLGAHGVVLGKLFRQVPPDQFAGPEHAGTIEDPERVSETGGRALVQEYWGR